MNITTLESIKSNYLFTDRAIPFLEKLYNEFGGYVLKMFLVDYDKNYTFYDLNKVEEKIREIFICKLKNQDDLCLDEIFNNFYAIMDEEEIIYKLCSKGFVDIIDFYYTDGGLKKFQETIILKETNWNKCPKSVQQHFLNLKNRENKEGYGKRIY